MRWYGKWAGEPKGTPEDTTRCIVSIVDEKTKLTKQCGRKRGYGPNGLFCKQHADMLARNIKLQIPEDEPEANPNVNPTNTIDIIKKTFAELKEQIEVAIRIAKTQDVYEGAEHLRKHSISTYERCNEVISILLSNFDNVTTKKLGLYKLAPDFYSFLPTSIKRDIPYEEITKKVEKLESAIIDEVEKLCRTQRIQ
jgi:hypothetical protein